MLLNLCNQNGQEQMSRRLESATAVKNRRPSPSFQTRVCPQTQSMLTEGEAGPLEEDPEHTHQIHLAACPLIPPPKVPIATYPSNSPWRKENTQGFRGLELALITGPRQSGAQNHVISDQSQSQNGASRLMDHPVVFLPFQWYASKPALHKEGEEGGSGWEEEKEKERKKALSWTCSIR